MFSYRELRLVDEESSSDMFNIRQPLAQTVLDANFRKILVDINIASVASNTLSSKIIHVVQLGSRAYPFLVF